MRRIDADALKAEWYKINDIGPEDCGARFVGYQEIARLIDNAPTVEPVGDYISRSDAIEAVMAEGRNVYTSEYANAERIVHEADAVEALSMLPSAAAVHKPDYSYEADMVRRLKESLSADAVSGYTEWLEKIIVDAETFEWLCEDTNDREWCANNCRYSSIQAECLRHLYEVSKGGDLE